MLRHRRGILAYERTDRCSAWMSDLREWREELYYEYTGEKEISCRNRIEDDSVNPSYCALIGYLTATEYYPKAGEQETVPVMHENDSVLTGSGPLRIMTWNVGYGALGDNADFFMDGGSGVNTATKDRVQENVSSMLDVIEREDPDILFLQEVDLNSMRSHHTNEVQLFSDAFSGMESDCILALSLSLYHYVYDVFQCEF